MYKKRLIISIVVLLAIVQGSYGIKVTTSGGDSSGCFYEKLDINAPNDGELKISSTIGDDKLLDSSGTGIGDLYRCYSETSRDGGSTATIVADVKGAGSHWKYTAPGMGASLTSARLSNFKLTATEADTITCTAQATRADLYDVKGVMKVSDPEGHLASLSGYTSSAVANADGGYITQDGNVHGILERSLGYVDPITSEYIPELTGTSTGVVDAALKEKAIAYSDGTTNYETSGTFYVNQAGTANKIQNAVDAAFKGDVIKIAAGTYHENVIIPKSLDITGDAKGKTIIDGSEPTNKDLGSVFIIGPDATVSLSKMTIQGGSGSSRIFVPDAENDGTFGGGILNFGILNMDHCSVADNKAVFGGGIYNGRHGTLNLNAGTSITDNKAYGIDEQSGFGGGIFNRGKVNMNAGSSIYDNTADYEGGGIYSEEFLPSDSPTVTMNAGSSIHDNNAIFGGGIFSVGHLATVTMNKGSSIHDNNAIVTGGGGGIYNWYGTVTMNSGSSIFNNNAGYMGGGILNDDGTVKMEKGSSIHDNTVYSTDEQSGFGGGIYSNAGTIDINGSIFGNTAPQSGGGIYEKYAIVTMNDGGTIYDNKAIFGGGIFSYGQVYMNPGSSIHDNKANFGGGIYNFLGIVGMDSGSSITDNTASGIAGIADSGVGGGIYNYAGPTSQGGFGVGHVVMKSGSSITRNKANIGGGIYNRYDPINNDYGMVTFVDSNNNVIPIYDPTNNDYLHFFGPRLNKPDNTPDDVYPH